MNGYRLSSLLISIASNVKMFDEFSKYAKVKARPNLTGDVVAFLRYVRKHRKSLKPKHLEVAKVNAILYPDRPHTFWRTRQLISEMTHLAIQFLMLQELWKHKYLQNFLLAQSLNNLKQGDRALSRLQDNFNILPEDELQMYRVKAKTHTLIYFSIGKNLKDKKKKRHHLVASLQDEEIGYTISKLKKCATLIVRKLLFEEPYEEGVEERINRNLACIPYRDEVPLIDLLADVVFFLLEPTCEKYTKLKEKFLKHLDIIQSEKGNILTFLINGLALINHTSKAAEYFELYKLGIEKGYLLENGVLSANNFNNTIYIACQTQNYDWAQWFVNTHFERLNKEQKDLENIKILYECFLHFYKKEFHLVTTKLGMLSFEDYSYGLRKYTLELKSLYEIDKHHAAEEMRKKMFSYRSYLGYNHREKNISKLILDKNMNMMKILKGLLNYPYKNFSKEDLLTKLDSFEGEIVEQKWLRQKIAQLKRY